MTKHHLPCPPPRYVNKLLQVIVLDKAINTDGTRHVPAPLLALIVDMFCFFVQVGGGE